MKNGKILERVFERSELTFSEQQFSFMLGTSTYYRCIVCRESVDGEVGPIGPKEQGLHCVFVDLEKAHDKVPQ